MPTFESLAAYWSSGEMATNGVILLNLLGALALGLLVGYERSYHGRAAGMRTYGLVRADGYRRLSGILVRRPYQQPFRHHRSDPHRAGHRHRHRLPRRRRHHARRLQHQRPDDGRVDLGLVGDRRDGRPGILSGGDGLVLPVRDVNDLPLQARSMAAVAPRGGHHDALPRGIQAAGTGATPDGADARL